MLVAPAGVGLRPNLRAFLVPLTRALGATSPRMTVTVTADAARAGLPPLLRTARELLADAALAEELPLVRAPTLLVWGERDPLVPAELAERFLSALPDARLHVVARAGHVPMDDAPDEVARAILAHLRLDGRA